MLSLYIASYNEKYTFMKNKYCYYTSSHIIRNVLSCIREIFVVIIPFLSPRPRLCIRIILIHNIFHFSISKMSLTYRITTEYNGDDSSDDSDYGVPKSTIYLTYKDKITVTAILSRHNDPTLWNKIISAIENNDQYQYGGGNNNGIWSSISVENETVEIELAVTDEEDDIILNFTVPSNIFLPVALQIRDDLLNQEG